MNLESLLPVSELIINAHPCIALDKGGPSIVLAIFWLFASLHEHRESFSQHARSDLRSLA
jgi:hypothetical protein